MEHNQYYLHYLHSKSEWFSNFLHFSYHMKLKVFLTLPTLLHSRKLCSNFCVKFTILSFEKFMIFQLLWTLPTLPTFANIRNIHNIQDTKKWKSVTNRAISIYFSQIRPAKHIIRNSCLSCVDSAICLVHPEEAKGLGYELFTIVWFSWFK